MKIIKKAFLYLFCLMVLAILFRGCIYRTMFSYKSIGDRKSYVVQNQSLVKSIDENDKENQPDIDDIIDLSLKLTSKYLHFVAAKNYNDPNKLIDSKKAHCVGYAAFFAATSNYLLEKHGLKQWHAEPRRGQISFLGESIHKHFSGSFFKDHDFVILENKITKEKIAVDPTLYDYFYIKKVNLE